MKVNFKLDFKRVVGYRKLPGRYLGCNGNVSTLPPVDDCERSGVIAMLGDPLEGIVGRMPETSLKVTERKKA